METFLEFMSSRNFSPTHDEITLLLKARNKLEDLEWVEDVKDFTSKVDNPYLWIPLPDDVGGGLRIYVITDILAMRKQDKPESLPFGKPLAVLRKRIREKEDEDEIKSYVDEPEKQVKDFDSSIDRLPGEIMNFIRERREDKTQRDKALKNRFGSRIQFNPFWRREEKKDK